MKTMAAVRKSVNIKRIINPDSELKGNMIGLKALFSKEFADHLTSKRFLIILVLIWGTSLASLYGALTGIGESASEYLFLDLYTLSGSSIPSFMNFMALLGPFVGLILGFDGINKERAAGTLNRLVANPIHRDSIIIAKFLAGCGIIVIIVSTMGILIDTAGVLSTGQIPTGEEVGRIVVFLFFTMVYMAFWLGLSIFFSVICKHSATSAMAVIALWLFFAIFMTLVVNILTGIIYPIDTDWNYLSNGYKNYVLEQNLNRISPYYLFSEASSTIMNPSVRTINVVTYEQVDGAITGYLSFGQSVLLVWPHLVALFALMIASFVGSYVGFMRQEIRSN